MLEFQPTSEAILVTADKLRIEQVITNLLSNAIKFSPNNGKVTVRVEQAEGSDAIVFVEDEGPGIDNESKEKIFQPFTQTESHMTRKTSGTGLGLSISKSIIEKHRGTIGVNNRVKGGSCFYFTLPSAREAY